MKIRLFILYLSTCLFFLQITAVKADYVDPSVMTYAIQSIAGLLIGLGTFFGVYWRKIPGSFQDTSLKEIEPDTLSFHDPGGETRSLSFADERVKTEEKGVPWFVTTVLLSAGMSFMLVVYKPLQVLFMNLTEFKFDFVSVIPYILLLFVAVMLAEFVIHAICRLISGKLWYVSIIAASICYFAFYIQGNILVNDLPEANGGEVDWSQFHTQKLQSLVLWIVLILLITLAAHFLKKKAFLAMTRFSVSAVTVILAVILVSLGITKDGFTHEVTQRVTTVGLNEFSEDRNFLILIPDMMDSRTFKALLESDDPDFADVFEDFTYYPDTMGCYPSTRYSIPQILTGEIYLRDRKFSEFYNQAMDESPLLNTLLDQGYELTAYDPGDMYYGSHRERYRNITERGFELEDPKRFVMDILRLVFFYHMPYQLKQYEPYAIYNLTTEPEKDLFSWKDLDFYNWLTKHPVETVSTKQFHVVHFEGAHTPYRYTKDLEEVIGTDAATYEGNVEGAVTVLNQFLQNMKDKGVFDNTVIVIMGDHGYDKAEIESYGKQNPLLLVKGINEKHPFTISKMPLSFTNLQEIYTNLLQEKTGENIVNTIKPSDKRLYYYYQHGEELIEEVSEGPAWDMNALVPTGRNFGQEPDE